MSSTFTSPSSCEQPLNELISSLVSQCLSLMDSLQSGGCDNNWFLMCVKKSTEETLKLFNYVTALETARAADKEELLHETVVVKNVVIKLIKEARAYHKALCEGGAGVTPPTPLQLAPLKAELGAVIKQWRVVAKRFFQGESIADMKRWSQVYGVYASSSSSSTPVVTGGVTTEVDARQQSGGSDEVEKVAGVGGVGSGGAGGEGGGEKDVAKIAVRCLQAFEDLTFSLQQREREPFAISTRNAINLVNQLVSLQLESSSSSSSPNINKDNLIALRQNLVSLVSHSKMYFVNPEDDYIKNTFMIFKEKVEKAIKYFIPPDYPLNIEVRTPGNPPPMSSVMVNDGVPGFTPGGGGGGGQGNTLGSNLQHPTNNQIIGGPPYQTMTMGHSRADKISRSFTGGDAQDSPFGEKPVSTCHNPTSTSGTLTQNNSTFSHLSIRPSVSATSPAQYLVPSGGSLQRAISSPVLNNINNNNNHFYTLRVASTPQPPSITEDSEEEAHDAGTDADEDYEGDTGSTSTTPAATPTAPTAAVTVAGASVRVGGDGGGSSSNLSNSTTVAPSSAAFGRSDSLNPPLRRRIVNAVTAKFDKRDFETDFVESSNPETGSEAEQRSGLEDSSLTSVGGAGAGAGTGGGGGGPPHALSLPTTALHPTHQHTPSTTTAIVEENHSSSSDEGNLDQQFVMGIIRDEESADNEFSRTILDLVKMALGPEWDNSEPEKIAKFEQGLRTRLNAYKKLVLATQQQSLSLSARPRTDSPVPRIRTGAVPSIKTKVSVATISVKPPPQTKPIPFELYRKARDKQISFRELEPVRLSRAITTSVCSMMSVLYQFVSDFADNGKGYIKPSDKALPRPSEETKENLKNKLYELQATLSKDLKEAMSDVLDVHLEANLELIRTRAKETFYILLDKKGEPYKMDETLFGQGQYIRLFKQSLLKSLYFKAENLLYSTSQFLAVMQQFSRTDTSHSLHLLCMGMVMSQAINDILNETETFRYVLSQDQLQTKQTKKPLFGFSKTKPKTDSIWEEKEEPNALNKDDLYRPGTLNSLVIRMTDKEKVVNSDFVLSFFTGHELFSDSKEIWSKFEERYTGSSKHVKNDDQVRCIKIRLGKVLNQWVKNDLHAIDPGTLGEIDKFTEKMRKDNYEAIASFIQKELENTERFVPLTAKDKERFQLTAPKEIPLFGLQKAPMQNLQPYEILLSADPYYIAEQITILEFDVYCRIAHTELINRRWTEEKYQVLARNVSALVQRSDKLSHFIATSILLQKRLKDRTIMLTRCIKVARALAEIHNYNGLMGILMGLTLSSILRLRHTWSKLPPKVDLLYKQLAVFQDPSNSFKNCREAIKMKEEEKNIPCLPYFTLSLSDLTFMDEGNPDLIDVEDTKLINLPKHQLVYRTIKQLRKYQSTKYELYIREPLYTFLYQMPGLDDKELYSLSLEREPRPAQLRELEIKDKREV